MSFKPLEPSMFALLMHMHKMTTYMYDNKGYDKSQIWNIAAIHEHVCYLGLCPMDRLLNSACLISYFWLCAHVTCLEIAG